MGMPLSLLLLEDSLPDAELIVRELRRAGYDPLATRATNEEEFDAGLAAGNPQVILADSSLPLFSMSRALDLLRARGLDIPVIVVTGARGYERAEECINLGAADYVLKDDLSRLPKAVEQAITKRKPA
jgi:CheY-like chemotaxis protein